MNKVILIGNLTKDPVLKVTSNEVSVCMFALAVNRDYLDSDGTRSVDFFYVTVWRGLAENCHKFLKKGHKVCVVGSMQVRNYDGTNGIKRVDLNVVAEEVEFLTPKNSSALLAGSGKYDKPVTARSSVQEITDDDLPN